MSGRRGREGEGAGLTSSDAKPDSHPKGVFVVTVARVPARFLLLAGAVALALVAAPAVAHAGTYDVVACDAAPGGASGSWTGTASALMTTNATCPTGLAPQN